ncbi:MAG: hypothetical protein IT427_18290 [Pirellulales bacterium]|nr:hypothetical protein [Pirellulales bacterium]
MGLSGEPYRRLLELVQEAREMIGGCSHADGRPMTFDELEVHRAAEMQSLKRFINQLKEEIARYECRQPAQRECGAGK